MNWSPTPSGTPTTFSGNVYMTNVTNANRLNPWPNGAATSPAYCHHAAVMKLANSGSTGGNRLYASFSTHPLAEDVRGQWVSYCYSDDNGTTWTGSSGVTSTGAGGVPFTLFACPDSYNYELYQSSGYCLQNCGFFEYDSKMYALCQCTKAPRAFLNVVCYFVREVSISGGLGTPYRLGSWGASEFSTISEHADSEAMIAVVCQPENRNYILSGPLVYPYPMAMTEPASVLLGNGDVLRFWRAGWYDTSKFWVSTISDGVETFEPAATPVPNDPSASCLMRLSNGKLAWCLSAITGNSRKVLHLATSTNDGQDWQKIYTVRTETYVDTWWVDTSKGSQMTGGGNSYPALIENDGKLVIVCSYLKQIMRVHHIPVSSL